MSGSGVKARARHYLDEGQFLQAKNHYCQAVELQPGLLADVLVDYEKAIARQPQVIGPRLSLAGFVLNQGELEHAIAELEEALEIDPQNVEIYNVLGRIFIKQGDVDAVIALLERSLGTGLKDVSLVEILANAYLEKGRLNDAIKFYNEALIYKPNDKQILRTLGELYTRTELYNYAAEKFQAMFSDDPEVSREVIQRLEGLLGKEEGNVFIREILANVYLRSLKPELAVAKYLEIIRLDRLKLDSILTKLRGLLRSYPGHPQATLALAEVLRRQGNFSEAIELYHDLVNPTIVGKNKPEFFDAVMAGYQEILAECPEQLLARTYLAEIYLSRGRLDEVLDQYEFMLRADPETAETVIKRCREIIKNQPQLLAAMPTCLPASTVGRQARLILGRAHLAADDAQKAAVEAENLIADDKNFAAAYSLLGDAYFQLKLDRKAVGVLAQALALDPFNLQAQAGYQAAKERELAAAVEQARNKIAADPWKQSLHLDLAKLFLQQRQAEAAIRELQAAAKDESKILSVVGLLGCLYRSEGRYDLAAAQFSRGLDLLPPEQAELGRQIRFNLGTVYEAQGLASPALKIYEELLQEDIDFADLRRRVKYLKSASLKSMQTKALIMAMSQPESKKIVVFWGREAQNNKISRKEDVSLSFGHNHNAAGFDFYLKGMVSAALEEFQLAVQLDVGFATALNNLAVCLVSDGKLREAKVRLEEALKIEPSAAVLHNNLGLVTLLLAQPGPAVQELEKAYAVDPENPAICLNLGDAFYAQKNIRRALELYRQPGKFGILAEIFEDRLRFKQPPAKAA
ncbi:tetratricopeptide repeat protein [Candidatus Saganbacteria bacterium]|nr:tetratricopeptide repeat protein [Candidatus Saganbacteria bacterium]